MLKLAIFLATAILASQTHPIVLEARFSDSRESMEISVQPSETILSAKLKISDLTRPLLHPGGFEISYAGEFLDSSMTVGATRLGFAGEEVQEIMVQIGGFPQTIGPFTTKKVRGLGNEHFTTCGENRFSERESELKSNGIGYQISEYDQIRLGFFGGDRPFLQMVFGYWSPKRELTLDAEIKEKLEIPSTATYVVWSYPVNLIPLDGERTSLPPHTEDNYLRTFFEVGGYVYLNRANEVVGVLTIIPTRPGEETVLQFGEPQEWKPEWTEDLHRNQRFQPITLPFLKEKGAEYFCWINPGEQIPNGPKSEHGAFVYLFHEDALTKDEELTKFDRIFHILNKGDEDYNDGALDDGSESD